jgi:hypothetical protein
MAIQSQICRFVSRVANRRHGVSVTEGRLSDAGCPQAGPCNLLAIGSGGHPASTATPSSGALPPRTLLQKAL